METLEHRQLPLWGKKKSKTEARPVIRTKNCALPYGSPGPQTCCHFIPSNPGVQASSSEQTEAARGSMMGPDPHGLPGSGRANRLDSSSLPELRVMHLSAVLFREGGGQGLGWNFSQPWLPCLWWSRKGPEGRRRELNGEGGKEDVVTSSPSQSGRAVWGPSGWAPPTCPRHSLLWLLVPACWGR